jgi:uncharacterized damage-inducible protein DinB
MDRTLLLKLWDETWDKGGPFTPWTRAVADLTPAQADWSPGPGRHSIWQNINHVCAWREYILTKIDGRPGPSREDMAALNFAPPPAPTHEEWRKTLDRLRRTHEDCRAVIADPARDSDRLAEFLLHDSYHLGQVMLLRALQGLPPVD